MSKYTSIEQLINQEHEKISESNLKYKDFFDHAMYSHSLFQRLIVRAKPEAFFFLIFLSQIRKHHLLAILSAARLHHVQMFMNLRQVLEAGAIAAYGIGNPKTKDYAKTTELGLLEIPEKLSKKRYKWLDKNYPRGSEAIQKLKKQIQQSAHSNIVDAHRNFRIGDSKKLLEIQTPFFDRRNDFQIKSDFWVLGNVAMGLTDLFYGINKDYNTLTFADNFVNRLQSFARENNRLKELQMNTRKFKKADKIAKMKEKNI